MGSKLGPTLPSKNPSLTLKTPELAHHAHQVLDLPLLAGANYVENRFGDVAGVDPFSVRERTDSSSPLSAPLSRHYSSQMRSAPLSVRCCLISALITTRRSSRDGRTASASRMPEPPIPGAYRPYARLRYGAIARKRLTCWTQLDLHR